MQSITKKVLFFFLSLILVLPTKIFAIDTSPSAFLGGSVYNNLISNDSFIDENSMDANSIQNFLIANNSYLKDYSEGGKSAAQIIYEASHGLYDDAVGTAKGITIDSSTGTVSPRVILVFLQKEQSLVSRTTRNDGALNAAMGYGCPDGGGCDPTKAGFETQVGWGAWQLRYNYEAAQKSLDWWNTNYGAGNASICYSAQTKTISDYTGSYSVTFANAATASIYRYTPHVFDSAYNAWKIFNDWFTPSPPASTGNDIAAVAKSTYAAQFIANGTKTVEAKAYIGDVLLAETGTTWSKTFDLALGTNSFAITYKDADGNVLCQKNIVITRKKTADSNGDTAIDSTELSILADSWGKNVDPETAGDFNGDGVVDSTDLSILADAWGK